MSDFNHATASCPGVSSSNSSHLPIQFHQWYPIYRKQSIKSLIIELPQSFISYIQDEDSIHLPPDVISAATGDHFSDDEDLHEVDEEEETTGRRSQEARTRKQAYPLMILKLLWRRSSPRILQLARSGLVS